MIRFAIPLLALAWAVPSVAQDPSPDVMMLAQAHDRCMTTVAVRESHNEADDSVIFDHAVAACADLDAQLQAAIRSSFNAQQSAELIAMMDEQARTNFMQMLVQIRAGRNARGGAE